MSSPRSASRETLDAQQSIQDLADRLAAMPLESRLACIAGDVASRRDEFAAIPAYQLAELVGVCPIDVPDGSWGRAWYVDRRPVDEICSGGIGGGVSDLFASLAKDAGIAPERIEHLTALFEADDFDGEALTPQEGKLLQDADMEYEADQCGGARLIADYTIELSDGRSLRFETEIGDGGESGEILGPYDDRDGKFLDLTSDDYMCTQDDR